jgi:hypothetical protein
VTKVLAAIDNTAAATARAAAKAAGVPLRTSNAEVVPALQEAGGAADVAALVLGARATAAAASERQ